MSVIEKKGSFESQGNTGAEPREAQTIEIHIVERNPNHREDGCACDQDGDIEVWAGDTISFINNPWSQDTDILIPCELFLDPVRVPIKAEETKDFVVGPHYTQDAGYSVRLACDLAAGGPRFVPKP